MHGRFFAGRRVEASLFTGKQRFKRSGHGEEHEGGGEEGEQWHRDGMLAVKQNSFDDFIAAGEWLVEQGWTSPERLGISGGSNGGLLVGATLTQRPDLAAAVVCSAPLLDMVRYELFGLGRTWNDEYGTADDAGALGWLLATGMPRAPARPQLPQ